MIAVTDSPLMDTGPNTGEELVATSSSQLSAERSTAGNGCTV